MLIRPTALCGCYEIIPNVIQDHRGILVKTFHLGFFREHRLETRFAEQYYSCSSQGVLRGLHFQLPPRDHAKLVYCLDGRILDAVVDLRAGSPSYGRFLLLELNSETKNILYIPAGMAHGFYTVSGKAVVVNQASTVYSPEHDSGIRWDSAGIPWPDSTPVLSEKDGRLPLLSDFKSPFLYKGVSGNGI